MAKPSLSWPMMRLALAALGRQSRQPGWQGFCLAKQASIRYTAWRVGCCKLCHSFGNP